MNKLTLNTAFEYLRGKRRGAVQRLARLKILEYTGLFRGRVSYAQFGEDIVAASVFWYLRVDAPTYLDIGAYSHISLSNTYYFYKRGSRGVCVEPNPAAFKLFRRIRRRDHCLQAGVGVQDDQDGLPFYVLKDEALSTFDEASARTLEQNGFTSIESVVPVPVYSVNTLIERFCQGCPDFLSIDVEGMDLALLQSIDFVRYRPTVISVETIDFQTQAKDTEITEFLYSQGYRVQADTIINTIYVDNRAWEARLDT